MAAPDAAPAGYLRRDLVVGALVFALWIVPIVEGALNRTPNRAWPAVVRDMTTVSCLFSTRPERFRYFYLQVRRDGGEWEYVSERELFPMEPFGHRSRFDRFMERWGSGNPRARDDLARWLAARDRQLRPQDRPLVAVRFLSAIQEIRADQPPQGHWHKPDPAQSRPRVDSTHPLAEAP
jgi:hypothetical protein